MEESIIYNFQKERKNEKLFFYYYPCDSHCINLLG